MENYKSMNKKISVIIPSYNHQNFIEQTIKSVINQTYKNLEIIVIDDGSFDQSCSIISSISDQRLKFFQQENQGAHNTINRGLNIATGDYIAILNSDDIYHPQRLEECLKLAEIEEIDHQGSSLFTSYIEIIDDQGKSLGIKESFKNMFPYEIDNLEKTFIPTLDPSQNIIMFNYVATTSNFFFHHNIYKQIGNFYGLRYTHDWDYLLRLIQNYQIKVIEQPLLKYRVHASNTIKENQARMILEICWTLAKNLPDILHNTNCFNSFNNDQNIEVGSDNFYWFFNRLYNSIKVYNCEKILLNLILMFQVLKQNNMEQEIMAILEPDNTFHKQLIDDINKILTEKQNYDKITPVNNVELSLRQKIKNLTSKIFR